ncbi:MAG: LamG-like jellyroll fold domain-containing protein [Burkholderiales bacterium]|nr:LamG-like jellyroll fold domain-containing protein [Burkholderiales bacterium]
MIMPAAGATGDVVNRQTANGGDAGNSAIIAFREVRPTFFTRASTAWNTGTTWSVAGCNGVSAGAAPVADADVVICTGHTVPLDTSTPSLGSLTIQSGGVLNIGNSGTARTLTVAGDVDNAGTLQYVTAAAHAVNIGGAFTNTGTFTSAAVAGAKTIAVTGLITNSGIFRFAGTAAMTVTATGGIINSNIFDVSTVSNVTHTLNVAGDLTNSGTVQLAPDADSLVNTIFNGTVQVVGGTAGATFNNVTTTGTTVVTVAQPQVFSGTLTLGSGTTLNAGALSHSIAGNFTNNGATFNASTGTLTFNGAGAQAIGGSAGTMFNNLVTASTAAVTVSQPLVFNGNLTLGNATTFSAGASSHSIAGNFTNNGATFSSTGLFTFNGGSAQVIGGTTASTFNNLTINSAGVTLSGVNATAGSVLTLTSGVVTTGANVLIVTGNCPGSVARTAGHVAGSLRLRVPAGSPTCVFPIGDAAGYRPATAAFTTVSVAGDVTAAVTQGAGEHPDIGTSTIDPATDVNRYWILANSGTTFTSAVATFNYLAGDVDAGADQLAFVAGRYAAGAWTYPASTFSANSAQVSGLSSATLAGDFVFGENAAPALFSHWRMDQAGGWNGTAGEVIDSGSGGFPGTAAGLTTRPTTSITSPAIAGSPGTCYYGVFNRSNKDYVALAAGYPDLMSTAGGFTVTAWINTTNSALPGQRIFIDDQNNSSPGGWGFSVGETDRAGAGGLRFYYRQAAVVTVDTVAIPSNQWLFVALSVRLAAGANASSATLYAYNTAGVLVTTYSQTFTWTAGADGGPPSIGGETNASGEGSNAFGFGGNIDEVRVYQQYLSQNRINAIRQETRPCAFLNHIRIEHDGIGLTCAPETVTVKACTDALCSSLYTGSVTTTLSPTGWVGGNTITFTGSTNADLRRTTPGVVTLGAGTTAPAPTSATLCFNGLAQTCDIDFKNTGFLFSAIPVQTAGTTSATHTMQAVRTDINTGACTGVFTGNVPNIELASECVNPATCQAGQQVTFTNNGSGVIAANNGGAVSAWTNRTLTFGADSTANFTFSYPDVGQMRLHARHNIAGSGDYMSGSSSNFVVKPAGFTVTNILRTADSFANPGAADAGGAVFMKAGEAMTLTATAVNSLGAATPNYGKEAVAEGVRLTSALAPGLGLSNDPGLGNGTIAGSAFTAGSATVTNVTWGEVGIITITPSVGDTDYLGAGEVTGTTTGNIGRFTPHHFDATPNTPAFAAACGPGGFTYMGQPFVYSVAPTLTVTARNLAGGTTSNYKGTAPPTQAFFKISDSSLTGKAYTAASGAVDASGITLPDPAITDNGNGTATLTFNAGTGLLFTRSTPVAAFDAEIALAINVIDGDGIAYPTNPATIGQASAGNGIGFTDGKAMRFGRLRVGGASGSQLLPLRVPFEAQYWNGTFFVTHAADTCTTLATANIGLGNYLGNLDALETTVTAVTSPLQAGRGRITLSAPGAGNNGSVDVTVNLGPDPNADACPAFAPAATAGDKAYLRGQWCGAAYTRDPAARARFGIRRSSDEIIYMRESTN